MIINWPVKDNHVKTLYMEFYCRTLHNHNTFDPSP